MMNRAYGYDELNGMPFTDVRSRDWFYDDIDIGYNIGYFKGTGATTASPNAPLTREQAAVLLSRNLMLRGTTGETLEDHAALAGAALTRAADHDLAQHLHVFQQYVAQVDAAGEVEVAWVSPTAAP